MAAHRSFSGAPRTREIDPRGAVGMVVVAGMLVVAALVLVLFARAISSVKIQQKTVRPPEQQLPGVQRARDPSTGLVFRVEGSEVAVVAKGKASTEGLRGRSLLVQCGFLAADGATIAQGRGRWARGSNEMRATLSHRPGRFAQFCSVAPQSSDPPLSRAVFDTPRPPPADQPR